MAQSLFERLIKEGYEVNIIPVLHSQKGKMFRVAVGAFADKGSANNYGKELIDKGVIDYSKPIRIDVEKGG